MGIDRGDMRVNAIVNPADITRNHILRSLKPFGADDSYCGFYIIRAEYDPIPNELVDLFLSDVLPPRFLPVFSVTPARGSGTSGRDSSMLPEGCLWHHVCLYTLDLRDASAIQRR